MTMLSGLSTYKVLFILQLIAGEGVFLFGLSKRRHFPLRCALAVALLVLIAAFFPVPWENPWYLSFMYLFLFGCTLAGCGFCFEEPFSNLVFCGIGGYTLQHIAYLFYMCFIDLTQIGRVYGTIIDPYSAGAVQVNDLAFLELAFYVDIYVLVYSGGLDLFGPKLARCRDLHLGRGGMLCLSGLLIGADVISNMISTYYTTDNLVSLALERGYNVTICAMILAMLYLQLSHRELKDELSAVQYTLHQGRKQYELAKRAAEMVNIKYHDLRHRSERMAAASREEREELDAVLDRYGAFVQTGSEVLDVILTEKNLLCQQRRIQLFCMADGQALEFIKPHHLYALLGNALDNAVEAVEPLPEEERLISLYVRRQGELVHLHVENPCAAPVLLRGGLPVTSKRDHNFHGYGVLSMKTVAEQYGGGLSISVEEGIFSLDVVFPAGGAGERPEESA